MSQAKGTDIGESRRAISRVHAIAAFALCCEIASFLALLSAGRYVHAALIVFFLASLISFALCIRAAQYKQRGRLLLPLISAAIPLLPILLIFAIRAMGGIPYGH